MRWFQLITALGAFHNTVLNGLRNCNLVGKKLTDQHIKFNYNRKQ